MYGFIRELSAFERKAKSCDIPCNSNEGKTGGDVSCVKDKRILTAALHNSTPKQSERITAVGESFVDLLMRIYQPPMYICYIYFEILNENVL